MLKAKKKDVRRILDDLLDKLDAAANYFEGENRTSVALAIDEAATVLMDTRDLYASAEEKALRDQVVGGDHSGVSWFDELYRLEDPRGL